MMSFGRRRMGMPNFDALMNQTYAIAEQPVCMMDERVEPTSLRNAMGLVPRYYRPFALSNK